MIVILPAIIIFLLFVFLFCREIRIDCERYLEEDRLGDEHILKEVERFLKENTIK